MSETVIRARLRRWGNTYGIAVSPATVKQLGAREGQEVTVRLDVEPARAEFDDLAVLHLGRHAARDHDRLAGAGAAGEPAA